MRIGIDISQIVYGTGVSIYTQNLVENLLKIDKENEYLLFFSSLRRRPPQLPCLRAFRLPPTLLDLLWNRLHIVPIEKFVGPLDVFHTSDWTEPPAKCQKVTTIHDLTPLLFSEETHPKIVVTHKRKLAWVKKESSLIIAVSQATKKDIVRVLGIPQEKIKVIYEAVEENFKPQSSQVIESVKKKYGIVGDYVLAFGGPARKNLKRVKKACLGWQLFVIGQPYVPKEDLAALYSGALCLVYPSLYEGFGLPILEAMACGCPVVTANVSSMPEIAGGGAVLVDPKNIEGIAKGIKEAIKNRERLIKRGFRQAKMFDWKKTAKETLEVYKSLC